MTRADDSMNKSSSIRLLGRRPALDGLRGLAFLGVFLGHSELVKGADPGAISMFLFFGLSGFLITSLLIGERWTTGRIRLSKFFARRALRLLPALFLFLAVWLAVVACFGHSAWLTTVPGGGPGAPEPLHTAWHAAEMAAAYVMNWAEILNAFHNYAAIGHLWSLSVEEQFYLIWAPIVALLLFWRLRAVAGVAALLATAFLAEPPLLYHHGFGELRIYMGTDTRAAAFLIGSLLAIAFCRGRLDALARHWSFLVILLLAVGALVWAASPVSDTHVLVGTSTMTARQTAFIARWYVGSLAAPLVVALVTARSAALVTARSAALSGQSSAYRHSLAARPLTYIGQRSYALYLWHYVWLTWLRDLGPVGIPLALLASLASAELSWRLVETRTDRLKARMRAEAVREAAPVDA
jgi:peptidoglycan/LPS O-acetylase OafA/YrhL